MLKLLISFCLVLTTLKTSQATPIYSALSPKLIFPNSLHQITIFLEPETNPLIFSATITNAQSPTTTTVTSGQHIIHPGHSGVLTMEMGELLEPEYNLTLKVQTNNGVLVDEEVRTLFRTELTKFVLIHTDRPIYKPGDVVKFRVVVLNPNLIPFSDPNNNEERSTIQVRILDADTNIIKIWTDVQLNFGLFKNELQLSQEPPLGDWTVEVKVVTSFGPPIDGGPGVDQLDGEESIILETITFNVDKFVLPKFEVNLITPPFLTVDMDTAPIQIEAKYTYGKALAGKFIMTRRRDFDFFPIFGSDQTTPPTDIVLTGPLSSDGSGLTLVNVDIRKLFRPDEVQFGFRQIIFEATVTETVTGISRNVSAPVKVFKFPYKIDPIIHSTQVKPGLPFIVGFKVSTQDNIPIIDPSPSALKIHHGFSYWDEGSRLNSSIPSNPAGIITLTFDPPTNDLIIPQRIDIKYKDLVFQYYVPNNFAPPDDDTTMKIYMAIQILNGQSDVDPSSGQPIVRVSAGQELQVNVNVTQKFDSFNYVLVGGGEGGAGEIKIILSGKIPLSIPAKEVNFTFLCPAEAAPQSILIVYTIFDESSPSSSDVIVSDSVTLSVTPESDTLNYLDIQLSQLEREPGQEVTLKVNTSHPNSLVAIRGVDQSIFLLGKPDNDLKQEVIDEKVRQLDQQAINSHRNWGGPSFLENFDAAGLWLITNADLGSSSGSGSSPPGFPVDGRPAPSPAAPPGAPIDNSGGGGPPAIRVRSFFPETWLWEEVFLNETRHLDLIRTVPDTLTSWIISGYSLNKNFPLAILPAPLKLTVFRPFFVTLNLPYSVVKGEILILQILVHNHLPLTTATVAQVTLESGQADFQILDASPTKTVTLEPSSVTSVTFSIIPNKFGFIQLTVRATTAISGDALTQPLRVIPPGEQQRRSVAAFLTVTPTAMAGQSVRTANLSTAFPPNRVQGADSVKMTLIGDILGSSIQNLDSLLQLPVGCGEQNMLIMVGDIVVLNYLTSTHQLTSGVQARAISFLETGYQNQLTFRHPDGSYSAFGSPSDPVGSTWLTAFTTKSFIQAKSFITADDLVIEQALDFLTQKQDEVSGAFREDGRVLHTAMQGGSATPGVALTAYTVTTFIEAIAHWTNQNNIVGAGVKNYSQIVEKALNYIIGKTLPNLVTIDDNYALILTTYVLHLAGHPDKNKYFDFVLTLGVNEDGLLHWENGKGQPQPPPANNFDFESQSVDVEMTSYVLLVYLMRGQVADSIPIVRWLIKQRNENGGFVSTQDTAIGLTALAQFARLTKTGDTPIDLTVKTLDSNGGRQDVFINEINSIVLQEFILQPSIHWVNFEGFGSGSALVQLSWSYYILETVKGVAFSLDVKAQNLQTNGMSLTICTSFLGGGESNMVIVEVNTPSGYVVDDDDILKQELSQDPHYKKHETQNGETKLLVYLEFLDEKVTCFQVTGHQLFKLDKIVETYVSVYDYYDPTRKARVFYQLPATN